MFIGFYNRSIILTFIGLFSSIIGMNLCFLGKTEYATICLLISGICDCFDGYLASLVKRNKKEKEYGVQLDSLVDVVCFGIFPIVILYSLGYNKIYHLAIYCLYIFTGVTRLAYFNVDEEHHDHFKGLPITTISYLLPMILLMTKNEIVLMMTMVIVASLFIINFKVKKATLRKKEFYLVLGLITIVMMIWNICK